MTKLATVVIPISPEHYALGHHLSAIDSVKQQTIPGETVVVVGGLDLLSLEELRAIFAEKQLDVNELTGGVSVHWKILRKLMISRLKDLEKEAVKS